MKTQMLFFGTGELVEADNQANATVEDASRIQYCGSGEKDFFGEKKLGPSSSLELELHLHSISDFLHPQQTAAFIFTRTVASSDDAANQSTSLFSISLLHRRLPSLFFRRTCNWGEEGSGQVLIGTARTGVRHRRRAPLTTGVTGINISISARESFAVQPATILTPSLFSPLRDLRRRVFFADQAQNNHYRKEKKKSSRKRKSAKNKQQHNTYTYTCKQKEETDGNKLEDRKIHRRKEHPAEGKKEDTYPNNYAVANEQTKGGDRWQQIRRQKNP
ncbi:hypothetical protein LXL04_034346 [Taraxacum kok-saghyz]